MDDWSAAIWYACARPLCEAAYTPTVIESCAHRSVAIACSELCRNSLPSTEEERPARRPRMRAPLVSTGRAPPPRCARTASMAAEMGVQQAAGDPLEGAAASPCSQHALGRRLVMGDGVPYDQPRAVALFAAADTLASALHEPSSPEASPTTVGRIYFHTMSRFARLLYVLLFDSPS